jgi:hypothetical protein
MFLAICLYVVTREILAWYWAADTEYLNFVKALGTYSGHMFI